MRDALARVQAAVARHPRLLMTLFILGLLVVSADPVAAGDGSIIKFGLTSDVDYSTSGNMTTNGGVSGNAGPTNP